MPKNRKDMAIIQQRGPLVATGKRIGRLIGEFEITQQKAVRHVPRQTVVITNDRSRAAPIANEMSVLDILSLDVREHDFAPRQDDQVAMHPTCPVERLDR